MNRNSTTYGTILSGLMYLLESQKENKQKETNSKESRDKTGNHKD